MANSRKPKAEDHGEKIIIQIPAHPRWVRTVRLAAAGVASGLNFSVEDIEDIKLAVAEACNNAILHAQSPDKTRVPMVTVTLVPSPDRLEIRVEDEGRIEAAPRKKARQSSGDALPEGGLGLLIIESLMDDVQHQTGLDLNTTLRMVKYVRATS